MEPVLSFWFYKLPTVVFSYTIVIFFVRPLVAFAVDSLRTEFFWFCATSDFWFCAASDSWFCAASDFWFCAASDIDSVQLLISDSVQLSISDSVQLLISDSAQLLISNSAQLLISNSVLLLISDSVQILVVFAVVFGIVLYRMWMNNIKGIIDDNSTYLGREYTAILTPVVAGILNLMSIMILSGVIAQLINQKISQLVAKVKMISFLFRFTIKLPIFWLPSSYRGLRLNSTTRSLLRCTSSSLSITTPP